MSMESPPPPPPRPETDIRPVVVRHRRDPGPFIFGAAALLGAVVLFGALDAQRRAATAPATFATVAERGPAASPPPLYIPLEPLPPPPPPPPSPDLLNPQPPAPIPGPLATAPRPPAVYAPPAPSAPLQSAGMAEPSPDRSRRAGELVVFDRGAGRSGADAPLIAGRTSDDAQTTASPQGPMSSTEPPRATRLRQLATTVPQGTLIAAVLETALDSTRPGYVRALVTRDVRGFDGSHVLIPRGTRLFGEYQADLAPGQNRAFVRWTRLVRPDGIAIAVDSPAADALGRAGVQGRVNTHFVQRFASALLQSTVSIGLALASREIGDNAVVVALPSGAQSGTGAAPSAQVQPTLTVSAGATVTVFVAHDLNLPPVQTPR